MFILRIRRAGAWPAPIPKEHEQAIMALPDQDKDCRIVFKTTATIFQSLISQGKIMLMIT
jgi:hypothetical protein